MSLKALLEAYIQRSADMDRFSRRPDEMFDEYGVDEEIRRALANRDLDTIKAMEGAESIALLAEAAASQPFFFLFYPDPYLKIEDVKKKPDPIEAHKDARIEVFVEWDHDAEPSRGLPRFVRMVFEPMDEGALLELQTVPVFLDFSESKMRLLGKLRGAKRFSASGTYALTVEVPEPYGTKTAKSWMIEVE